MRAIIAWLRPLIIIGGVGWFSLFAYNRIEQRKMQEQNTIITSLNANITSLNAKIQKLKSDKATQHHELDMCTAALAQLSDGQSIDQSQ